MNIKSYSHFSTFNQSDSTTNFLRAARSGNLEKVLDFIDRGHDINSSNAVSGVS